MSTPCHTGALEEGTSHPGPYVDRGPKNRGVYDSQSEDTCPVDGVHCREGALVPEHRGTRVTKGPGPETDRDRP